MPEIYAFIPARAGSSRLESKNVRPMHGRPLTEWTVELARKSGLFDRIYVSTDIDQLFEKYKDDEGPVQLIERPPTLSGGDATLLEVIQHTSLELGWVGDARVALLQPTAPLRVSSDISEALRLFDFHEGAATVVSVSQNLYPPALLWEREGDFLKSMHGSDDPRVTRKQNHAETFLWNDIIALDSVAGWMREGRNLFGAGEPVALDIPLERCMPIDYPVQFRLAEALFPPVDERTGKKEWEL